LDESEEVKEVKDANETEEERKEKAERIMKAIGNELIDDLQALIGEQIEKYHEDKIRRDQGQSDSRPGPGRGMKTGVKPVLKKPRLPQALIQQYFTLN
jgi:hypothetical protein